MRLLLLAATVMALAAAKPESYKEKEDFQFSRSSSDEGTKSGFYGAQRGNMGGNYERAHNMDLLAQNQMSGVVKQVEGELGDGSKTRTGSVYTAANSRGVYGSGQYDLSNLAGRNFQEGVTYGNSQSHSSSAYQHQTSQSAYNNDQYQLSGHSGGYQAAGYAGQIQSSNLHAQAANSEKRGSEYYYSQRADQNTGYYPQSGNQNQRAYDNTNTGYSSDYRSNFDVNNRLTSAIPVTVVVRPGTRVTIPVAAQTYDDSLHSFSSNGQNSVNSDAEVLSNTDYQTIYQVTNKPKHYESSYRYHKEWEKHNTIPVGETLPIPTSNSFPKNSELYEDTQAHKTNSQFDAVGVGSLNSHSSNAYSRNNNANSAASSQSQYRTNYNSQLQGSSSSSNLNSADGYNAYNTARSTDSLNKIVGDLNSKPKSYQSSYSYHKSWERQGDPYVIRPATGSVVPNGQDYQRLTAASSNQGAYSSQQYGSNYQQSQQHYESNNALDCDDNKHTRVSRSYDIQQATNFNENQQSQNVYEGQEELGQQNQNLEDLGQQTQNKWDNLDDLGQQTQQKWDKLEEVEQQAQNKWDNIEDLGQQTQQKWDKLEEVGQQAQNKWENIEDLGQQTQQKWDNLEEVGQQAQNKWDNLEDLGQQTQQKWDKREETGQQTQNKWDNLEDLGQQTQKDLGQQTQDTWNNLDIKQENYGQQTQTNWDNLRQLDQQVQNTNDEGQIAQTVTRIEPSNVHSFDHEETEGKPDTHPVQTIWDKIGSLDRSHNISENVRDIQADTQLNQNNWHQVFQKENIDSNNMNFKSNQTDQLVITQNNDKKPVWEQNADNIQQSTNSDLGFNSNIMSQSPINYYDNFHLQTQTGNPNVFNINTQTDKYSQNPNIDLTSYAGGVSPNSPYSSGLGGLWGKIDNIVKESTTNDTHSNSFEFDSTNSQHSYQHFGQTQTYNYNSENTQHIYNNSEQAQIYQYNNLSQNYQKSQLSSNYIGHQSLQPSVINTTKTTTEQPINENKLRPQDIGRGDIGPEDSPGDDIVTEKTNNILDVNKSPEIRPTYQKNKFPEDIDSLSFTKEQTNSQNLNLPSSTQSSILSLNQQKWLEDQKQYSQNANNKSHTTTHLDQGPEEIYFHNISKNIENNEQHNENKQLNFEQQYGDIGQQNDQLHKNDNQQYEQQNTQLLNQQSQYNMEQQFESFGQQPDQQQHQSMDLLFESFGQKHEQQNMGQQLESFGQQHEQHNQQNLEQQFESFGQQNDKLDQQRTDEQFVDFGKQNVEQQLLGQQNENLSQGVWNENLEDLGQQVQTLNQNESLKQQTDIQRSDTIGIIPIHEKKEVPLDTAQNDYSLESSSTNYNIKPKVDIDSPQEEVTENPGFWKSVGNKFSSAKDRVYSWFKKS